MRLYFSIIFVLFASLELQSQGILSKLNYEPDEGGYPAGYTPARKIGRFDLSTKAANDPFRHLIFFSFDQKTPWDGITDFRDYGFRAEFQTLGKPKENSYADLNEAYFRDAISAGGRMLAPNPIYQPDPNRVQSAQGQTFKIIGGNVSSVTITNLNEDAKWNPFLLTSEEINLRAGAVSNAIFGFLRWDIEAFNPTDANVIYKGRQVWNGGQFRHVENGGTNDTYKNMTDGQFYELVVNLWSEHFTELFQQTKLHSRGSKIWKYGCGPIQSISPHELEQFDENGNLSKYWVRPTQTLWSYRNKKYGKTLSEAVDYLESWDFIPDNYQWAVTSFNNKSGSWQSTDIIQLRNPIQNIATQGKPTRYCLTDVGADDAGRRRIKISLHAQDGSLRVADQDYRIIFEHWQGNQSAVIQAGNHSVELQTSTADLTASAVYRNTMDDNFLNRIWTTTYAARLHEPNKLGFINWELTPRTKGLHPTDIFEQRVYDAVVAIANLQNFGVVHWDVSLKGKLVPMVRESIILAQKKIAPYKSHIENQSLCFVDLSMDGGQTWTLGGYPEAPNQERYNGWLLAGLIKQKLPAPMVMATYNATYKTFLVAHLGCGTIPNNVSYKIRIRVPNSNISYITDLTTSRDLKYSFFR